MRSLTSLTACGAFALLAALTPAFAGPNAIKIGVLTDLSGPYADLTGQGSVEAAKMAVEDFGGTVLGKKIVVLSADHQNKPDVGSSIVRQWYDVEGVDAVVDVPNTAVALAVQDLSRDKDRAFLMSGPASTVLINKACSPNGIMWTYDIYALSHGTGKAVVAEGGNSWFFITADYSFGHALEKATTDVVTAAGGKVLGSVSVPLGSTDYSSFLLQAQGSQAKIIGLANAGGDTVNSIKQAKEFGLTAGGQKLAALLFGISDVHSLGLDTAQGLLFTSAWYWDLNDQTRAFSKRFAARMNGHVPSMVHAGVYSEVSHYLKAMAAAKTDEAKAVIARMKEMPVNDMFAKNGKIREDGRMVHDMYLVEVKTPGESKYPWDYYKVLRTIPGDEAFSPLSESECPLVKK